jgi:hypothetical protein
MLSPGTLIISGRLRVVTGAPPAFASQMPGGFARGASGRLCIHTGAPAGNNYIKGIRTTTDGIIYGTTTVTPATDQFVAGVRVAASGALVYEAAVAQDHVGGDPIRTNGALAVINA